MYVGGRSHDSYQARLELVAVTGKQTSSGPTTDNTTSIRSFAYSCAGYLAAGEHDDFDEYDREMVHSQRAAVLVAPTRIIGNHPSMNTGLSEESEDGLLGAAQHSP